MKPARLAGNFLLAVVSPLLLVISALGLAITDLCFLLWGKKVQAPEALGHGRLPPDCATVVIPNWNGRDLLAKFLPSIVEALRHNPRNEIIVVDNASDDGSAEFLESHFPHVRVLKLDVNLGFGEGSNRGFAAANNDVVVLLNNDMRVEPDFLGPLLAPFEDELVFSVSCQIYFSDPAKRREETGLTQTWWRAGQLRVSHRVDSRIQVPYPCAYAGGGSSAFDRRKFLELGGFQKLLRPFYYEDTDLGHMAWKRGWKLLYQPASVVYHEHRGTIGRKFSSRFIEGVLKKNVVLYCWKNIHSWGYLLSHFAACFSTGWTALLTGRTEGRYTFHGLARAFWQLPEAVKARWRSRSLSVITDEEAFLIQQGGYFRDRFEAPREQVPDRLSVLFLSPYPIEPPVHGGAVFMGQTLRALTPLADVHLISFLDKETQLADQVPLTDICASTQFLVRHLIPPRNPSTALPHAIREFRDPDFAWAVQRTIYLEKINVVQIEYTILGQYGTAFRYIPCILFEHDVFFQTRWRGMRAAGFNVVGLLEYFRILHYELGLLKKMARVQFCSRENRDYVLGFLPEIADTSDSDGRAIIDTRSYRFVPSGREPNTMLFLGSFRHLPNIEALAWFTSRILPLITARQPEAQLVVIGSDPPAPLMHLSENPSVRFIGFVPDVHEALERYAVFICPILSGSGVRVKLLEAFASGIPVVSTSIGAEGLASRSSDVCEIGDSPEEFADAACRLLTERAYALELAGRARQMVEQKKDATVMTARLERNYRSLIETAGSATNARKPVSIER